MSTISAGAASATLARSASQTAVGSVLSSLASTSSSNAAAGRLPHHLLLVPSMQQIQKQQPSAQAILFRLLLATGSVLPGTIPCASHLLFPRQQPFFFSSSPAASSSARDGGLSGVHFSGGSSSSMSSDFQHVPPKLQQDDALASNAYAQWWQWLESMHEQQKAHCRKEQLLEQRQAMNIQTAPIATTAPGRASTSASNDDHAAVPQRDNNSHPATTSIEPKEDLCDAKFLFATVMKLGTILFFVNPTALQALTGCTKLTSDIALRAQHVILVALTKLPPAAPLPHPFLLAHLPGLAGATGEAYVQNKSATASTTRADEFFFSFKVQRAMLASASKHLSAGCVTMEVKFLDQTAEDEHGDRNDDDDSAMSDTKESVLSGMRRERDGALPAVQAADPRSVAVVRPPPQIRMWSAKQYGCARLLELPARAGAAPAAAGMINAITSCVQHNPPAGALQLPCYEEPFAVRFILLCVQRLLAHAQHENSAGGASLLRRTCGRLSFWAATVAASFPLDNPTKGNKTARTTRKRRRVASAAVSRNANSSRSSAALTPPAGVSAASASHNAALMLTEAQSRLLSLIGVEGADFNELVLVPVKAATLTMHCTLERATSASVPLGNSKEAASEVVEALLSVALAYASCTTFAAASSYSSASQNNNSGNNNNNGGSRCAEHIVRTNLVADACKWIRAFPAARLWSAFAQNSFLMQCLPDELKFFVEWKLAGRMSAAVVAGRKKYVDGSDVVVLLPSGGVASSPTFNLKKRLAPGAVRAAFASNGDKHTGSFAETARRQVSDSLDAFDHQLMLLWRALETAAEEEV